MFSKSHRVSARVHQGVAKAGQRFHSEYLTLKIAEIGLKKGLFSVVISKKVEKTAVGRNNTRRRIYPIIKNLLKDKVDGLGVWVFFVQKSIQSLSYTDLTKEIDILIKKAKI